MNTADANQQFVSKNNPIVNANLNINFKRIMNMHTDPNSYHDAANVWYVDEGRRK